MTIAEAISVISSIELGDQPRVQKVLLLAGEHDVTRVTQFLSRISCVTEYCVTVLDHVPWLAAVLTLDTGPKTLMTGTGGPLHCTVTN